MEKKKLTQGFCPPKSLFKFQAFLPLFISAIFIFSSLPIQAQQQGLHFNHLATRWDEAIPLGNGMLGALVWEKSGKLRLSLDRADLWDERKAMDLSKFDFQFVVKHVLNNNYNPVHQLGDWPYNNIPYPTKLPAAALQFNIAQLGEVVSNDLNIENALNTVQFKSGVVFKSYIHATKEQGFFSFENLNDAQIESLQPKIKIHNYHSKNGETTGLERLGYEQGALKAASFVSHYHQPTYDGHYFEVLIRWKKIGEHKLIGKWTITNNTPAKLSTKFNENKNWKSHVKWWRDFWAQSSVQLPDELLQKQYAMEMYKLGSVSRKGAPAITLQAVWTADNGSLPPWKGDFHNDLNTQLSYWPTYTGNHLQEAIPFTDWLWKTRPENKKFTQQYFGVEGLNVPGVETLSGYPMGGWIQYSLSPTVSAWLSQYFYWQWKYSLNREFLKNRAYPYITEAATYLENITYLKEGKRYLPLSSSPEYNDNRIDAWFTDWTNYDLSLAKFLFSAAAEVSSSLNKATEAQHWKTLLHQLPKYDYNETGLTVAPGQNSTESHRHFSQYMAIYPLALLDINNPKDKILIENSLDHIEKEGTRAWVGYSFTWMATLYARAYQGDKAAKQLQIFASNFCSPNSFHLNGDQKGGEYSNFTYRPFTLEGNFAFAQGIHELLLQSRNGYIEIFPAVPTSWKNVSFKNLRTFGALLVSGKIENASKITIHIEAEKGGTTRIKLPAGTLKIKTTKRAKVLSQNNRFIEVDFKKGGKLDLEILK